MDAATHLRGLTEPEASSRLEKYGRNEIHRVRSRSVADIARTTLREPMFLLLLAAAAIYLIVGDLGEGIFMLGGATLSFGLVIVQEARSERALRALQKLAEPKARVIREGETRTISASDLVPDDIILISEGGRVPADAILIEGEALEVDESTLSGESAPTTKVASRKAEWAEDMRPGEDRSPALFASTLVVRGNGVAYVFRTGANTEVGKIGAELGSIIEAPTLLQRDLRRLIGWLGLVAIGFCAVVAVGYGLLRDDWYGGLLSGLTLAISLIPEEFPVVLAIFAALGSWRMARHKVIVRRSAVIETLGATTMLCVDKTGTITENRMALRRVWRGGRTFELPADEAEVRSLIEIAQLASAVEAHDPMDAAIHAAAGQPATGRPIRSYPLRLDLLAFTQLWKKREGDGVVYATKGAHESVLALCRMEEDARQMAEDAARDLAGRGLRVLAVASAEFDSDPDRPPEKVEYRFEGLLGFEDPVRGDVPAALKEAKAAGVNVAMITGDHPATAIASASRAGIESGAGAITGAELAKGDAVPDEARIFARIRPEQKLQLVEEYRKAGHVVAMTGDGVNDAPALAAADIGIAMGQRGTDVAREASDLILLDDGFASIIGGIRLGRRIFANLRRALIYIAAVHVPIAGLAIMPLLLGVPPIFYPMQLVLLELLLDPLCALLFEGQPSEPDAMKKPPRRRDEPLFGRRQLRIAAVNGLVLLGAVGGFYLWMIGAEIVEASARYAAFLALVSGNLSLAVAVGSTRGQPFFHRGMRLLWLIAGLAALVLLLVVIVPMLAQILRFGLPQPRIILASLAVGLIGGGWYGALTRLQTQPRAVRPT